MKKILLLFTVMAFYNTSFAQWEFRGLDFTQTTDLTIYSDTIYASTYDGIYKQTVGGWGSPNPNPTTWAPCGMQGRHVVQTLVPDYLTFICVVEIDSTNRTQIYKSADGGNSFYLMTTDTSAPNNYQFLDAIAHQDGNYDTLYFLNHHLKTNNGGLTWDTLHFLPQNDRFITVHPFYNNIIIVGGETMILSPYIQVSYDKGNTWTFPAMNGFFAGDNSVHDITVDWNGNWYAAGEGVICMSADSGNNWTQIFNNWSGPPNFSLYNWDIENGCNGLFTTGSNTNSNIVPFIYYDPYHSYLDTFSTQPIDTLNPEMRCLARRNNGFCDDVFFGGHGVYVYQIIIDAIHENESTDISLFPNPFNDYLNLSLKNQKNISQYSLTIYNSFGQIISTKNNLDNFTRIDLNNICSGIYFIQITDENKKVVKRFKSVKI